MTEATKIASEFGIGVSTVNHLLDHFTVACVTELYREQVRLPTLDELEISTAKILAERGLPGCIGAVDGKHFFATGGTLIFSFTDC